MQDRATTYKGVNLSNNDSLRLLAVLFRTTGPYDPSWGGPTQRYSDLMPFADFCKQVATKKLPVVNGKVESYRVYGMEINWFTGVTTSFTVKSVTINLNTAQLDIMKSAIERETLMMSIKDAQEKMDLKPPVPPRNRGVRMHESLADQVKEDYPNEKFTGIDKFKNYSSKFTPQEKRNHCNEDTT